MFAIGDTVKVTSGAMTGCTGKIINTGEGYAYGEGTYVLYFVQIGTGKYTTVYQFRAHQLAAH